MKIGINLVGISYLENSVDWRYSKDNIISNVINCWENDEVVTSVTTYSSITTNELLDFYKPMKYCLLKYESSDQRLTYVHSLTNWINSDVDMIVSTRYDIHFYNKISNYGIDLEKMNFLFRERGWWDGHLFVTDNLFIFPKKYLPWVIDSLYEMITVPYRANCSDLHAMYRNMSSRVGQENLNILFEEHELSNTNSQYKLIRNTDWNDNI